MSKSNSTTAGKSVLPLDHELAVQNSEYWQQIKRLSAENLELKAKLAALAASRNTPPEADARQNSQISENQYPGKKAKVVHIVNVEDKPVSLEASESNDFPNKGRTRNLQPGLPPSETEAVMKPALPMGPDSEGPHESKTDIDFKKIVNIVSDEGNVTLAEELAARPGSELIHLRAGSPDGDNSSAVQRSIKEAIFDKEKKALTAKMMTYIKLGSATLLMLHLVQTYVACRRERGRWLQANNLSRTQLFGILHYDASLLVAPGVNPDLALGVQDIWDILQVIQAIVWSYLKSLTLSFGASRL
ncbi:hypothetical protein VHEMI02892 [[Torrubiella] hemipterigena]|uniref:Uncharacterized protein n=1 Tax=[Torrubiella] hemipterigena TaxID=1531966 RepID=A0A0A1SWZ5_9HYPO|nr:hypothetical protein VHEMI02892 [[Torrubiella] hemipterigena]